MQPNLALAELDVDREALAMQDVLRHLQSQAYAFTTTTPASHARVNARPGSEVARTLRHAFGWSRPFDRAILPGRLFDALKAVDLVQPDDAAGTLWRSDIRVSTLADMLLVHSAFPTTSPLSVFFGPDTYKFVDAIAALLARRTAPVRRAVDICCGAGPGALTIARAHPDAEILMVDINDRALRFAAANAAVAGAARARAVHSDLLDSVTGRFDLIVAHPPYLIDRHTRVYRHGGGPLGAALSLSILRAGIDRLDNGGTLLLFTGVAMLDGEDPFLRQAETILDATPMRWSYREVDPDVFGEELDYPPYDQADRIALVVLEVSRPG